MADDGFEVDIILSIARRAVPGPGAALALDGKNLLGMDVQFHTGVDERLELPDVLPLPLTGAG